MTSTYSKESKRATKNQTRQARKSKKQNADRTRKRKRIAELAAIIPEGREQLLQLMQDSMESFAIEIGAQVAYSLLEDEVQRLCGPRYQRDPERTASRHGSQPGVIHIGGQKVRIDKPRVRATDGHHQEIDLATYETMQTEGTMPAAALKRMLRGVSTRDYEGVIDTARDAFGIKKSSVSRGFVKATKNELEKFAAKRFDGQRMAAIMIDGLDFAGFMMVCAIGIAADGHKHVLGLRLGATEDAQVVASLLSDLRDRGISTAHHTLFVLDGSKALASGVKRIWGDRAVIQRCQVHKHRNVRSHLPKQHHVELKRRLYEAYYGNDYDEAVKQLRSTVAWLKHINPDAAASLSEGLEETLTVIRLGVRPQLRRTLSTTNAIESAFDRVRTLTRRVKRWRDGDMRHRWCLAGLQRAEESFNRVKGYTTIPLLIETLESQSLETNNNAA